MNANVPAESGGRPDQTSERLPAELTSFTVRKEARARELAARFNAQLPPVIWAFFTAAKQGDWPEVARLGEELRNLSLPPGAPRPDPAVTSQVWSAVMEIYMALAQFALGEPKYALAFGRDIIRSIPAGSVYFGGTDAGRGLVTALCRSHETGDPFFTLTQNALADRTYLRYLREIYGGSIFIPSEEDLQRAYEEYLSDFQRRKRENQLTPGEWAEAVAAEAISKISSRGNQPEPGEMAERVEGQVKISGQISVMAINGAVARLLFDRNPGREFFVEESFPLNWMYPHLAAHGLIMAICRQPLASLTPEQVEQDRKFWSDRLGQMLGDWLRPETPVSEVCAFAERVFLRKDLAGFTGDPKYVANEPACQAFSKLRSSIAGLYEWRARGEGDPAGQQRMGEAADFAFRQAFALDPRSLEAVFRCAQHFLAEHRTADALLVAETGFKLAPENSQLESLVQHLARRARNGQGQG